MNKVEARGFLRNRFETLDGEKFEQLCKIVIEQAEEPEHIELTPFRGDHGIDVTGAVGKDFYRAKLGVQAKRWTGTVGEPDMRDFMGAIQWGGYDFGAFITTSSFTSEVIRKADELSIELIDGDRLASLMLEHELGVEEQEAEYLEDDEFWEIFEEPERGGIIPTEEVPQADSFKTLHETLIAVESGIDVKHTIADYLREHSEKEYDDWVRQADYYCTALWILGFLHKDTMTEYNDHDIRQWGLTREGEEYLEVHLSGDEAEQWRRFGEAASQVEIVQRAVACLRENGGTMEHPEIREVIEEESDVGGNTITRRATTVGKWLAKLDNVTRNRGQTWHYELTDNLDNYSTSA